MGAKVVFRTVFDILQVVNLSLSVQDEGRQSAKYDLFFTLVWKTHWKIVGFVVEFFDVYDKCARMNDTKIHDLPSRSIPAPPPLRP